MKNGDNARPRMDNDFATLKPFRARVTRDEQRARHVPGKYSIRLDERADGGEGLRDGLIGGEALAFARIDDGANSRKQIAAPLGAQPVRALPEHSANTNGVLA